MRVIKAIKNDPKAIEPQFQKIPHLKDLQTLAACSGLTLDIASSSFPAPEKYHWTTVAATINY